MSLILPLVRPYLVAATGVPIKEQKQLVTSIFLELYEGCLSDISKSYRSVKLRGLSQEEREADKQLYDLLYGRSTARCVHRAFYVSCYMSAEEKSNEGSISAAREGSGLGMAVFLLAEIQTVLHIEQQQPNWFEEDDDDYRDHSPEVTKKACLEWWKLASESVTEMIMKHGFGAGS